MIDVKQEAEAVLERHVSALIGSSYVSYVSIEEMKKEPEWKATINALIEMTNSKYVQVKVLQGQIEILQGLRLGINDANTVTVFEIKSKIYELQQLLKYLENDNTNP